MVMSSCLRDMPLLAWRLLEDSGSFSAQAAQLSHIQYSPGSYFLKLHFSENKEEGRKERTVVGRKLFFIFIIT